jgi:hypothetical protein
MRLAVTWKQYSKKGDAPANHNDFPEGHAAVFKVAVPAKGHEDVGDDEQDDGSQVLLLCYRQN